MRFLSGRNRWFLGVSLITLTLFFLMRPLNTPSQRIIAADGLGYYSYLPARFIYNDQDLNFKWFNAVFNKEYDNHLFETPVDNFMVAYHNKKINKYYPGQSLLQLPFFLIAHCCALISDQPANGFSFSYQLAIGLAAVFYTLLGLLFCQKLLYAWSANMSLSILISVLVFFGTNLFTYTIFNGCYSHSYSFCMVTLVYYYAHRFFNMPSNKSTQFWLLLLFSIVAVSIRPLNLVLLMGVFYFYKPFKLSDLWETKKTVMHSFIILCAFAIAGYNLQIIYKQTGELLINSYEGEKFYFKQWHHLADNMVGFQYGILWYTPLIFLCFISVLFLRKNPRLVFLLIPLFSVIVLYSFWWYWNIVSRVIVDSTVIIALLLCGIYMFWDSKKNTVRYIIGGALLCLPLFQLKAYQLREGILDSNYTYAKYYFKHFLTLSPVHVFPVNPQTVVREENHFRDFENEDAQQTSVVEKYAGERSAVLNSQIEYACTGTYKIPDFFENRGFKKIKVAFWMRATKEINNIHLVFKFSRNDSTLEYLPFYIKDAGSKPGWNFMEFGTDLPENVRAGDTFSMYFWNPDHKDTAYLDNLKLEFFLTNGADEVTVD